MSGPKILSSILVVVIGLALSACSEDDGTVVRMESGQRFEPGVLTISVNESVTFINESGDAHTVTAYEDALPNGASHFASSGVLGEDAARDDIASGLMSSGESFEVRFGHPGSYRYFCIPHESLGMTGRIEVKK